MDRLVRYVKESITKMRNMDRADWERELRELVYHTKKQLFSQIPGVSAIAGILVGSWVAGTFTNSPVKGFLSSVGITKGGTHVVSTATYRFLSVVLPILATVMTAYVVQKVMKAYREKQLERNMASVALMGEEVRFDLESRIAILDKAKAAGLLSQREHRTKLANLYQSYCRHDDSGIEEIIINKLEG